MDRQERLGQRDPLATANARGCLGCVDHIFPSRPLVLRDDAGRIVPSPRKSEATFQIRLVLKYARVHTNNGTDLLTSPRPYVAPGGLERVNPKIDMSGAAERKCNAEHL